jgi:tetratricopeptide (TPR) repeat protein
MARIYSLNAVFCGIALITFFSYEKGHHDIKLLYFLSFITGAGSGLHLTFTITCGLLWLFIAQSEFKMLLRNFFRLALFFIIGLSTYFFITIRGTSGALLQWTTFTSSNDFYTYITQQEYKQKMFARDASGFAVFFGYIKDVVLRELSLAGIILAVAGTVFAFVKKNRFTILLLCLCLVNILVLSLYGNYTDLKLAFRYLIPTYMAGAILVFLLFDYSTTILKNNNFIYAAVIVVSAATAVLSFPVNFHENDRSQNYFAYFFPKDILETVPDNSYLFLGGDNQTFPVAYFKYVLKKFPSIKIFDMYPTIFKDSKELNKDSKHPSLPSTIIKAFSSGYYPVFSVNQSSANSFNEMPYGIVYSESDRPIKPVIYPWKFYSLKGIITNDSVFHDFEEREVVGNYMQRYAISKKYANDHKVYEYMLEKSTKTGYDSLPVLANAAIEYTNNTVTADSLSRAENLFKISEKLDPRNSDLLFNIGSFYGKAGKPEIAADYFDRVTKLNPFNINAILYKNRALSQAQSDYQQRMIKNKSQALHYEKALELFNIKKTAEADVEFKKDTEANPKLGRSYFYRGLILSMNKKYDEAIMFFGRTLEFDTNNVGALNNTGLCYIKLKKGKEAIQYFRRSLAIKPDQDRIKKMLSKLEKYYGSNS